MTTGGTAADAGEGSPIRVPAGFRAAGVYAGLYARRERLDVGLVLADEAFPAAALFTTSRMNGAHVTLGREHLRRSGGRVRALLVNTRSANCSTGDPGLADQRRLAGALGELVGCPPEQVLSLSTGVIGLPLPMERILAALPRLVATARAEGAEDFARAIMTTDTVPKLVPVGAAGGRSVLGIAKGSGMIHPDLATMLAFLLTDAEVPGAAEGAGELLERTAAQSFQRLSVDGDTSPNDTLLLWGSGARGRCAPDELLADLCAASRELCRRIAADGEGATRLVTIRVEGAETPEAAVHVGRVIATSPLTKTAVNGRDPNWGRILAAAARSGVAFDPARARVWIGTAELFAGGLPRPENEARAHAHLEGEPEVVLGIDLGCGAAAAEVWTCDLSADYVRINADYRS